MGSLNFKKMLQNIVNPFVGVAEVVMAPQITKAQSKAQVAIMQAEAATEAQVRAEQAIQAASARRRAMLLNLLKGLDTEAAAAAAAVEEIRQLSDSPLLAGEDISSLVYQLSEWEAVIEEIRAGVGGIDVQTGDQGAQEQYMRELSAAVSAMRQVRSKAVSAKGQVSQVVGARQAEHLRTQQLMRDAEALRLREQAQEELIARERYAASLEEAQRRQQVQQRQEDELQRQIAEERRRLAAAERALADRRRSLALMASLSLSGWRR